MKTRILIVASIVSLVALPTVGCGSKEQSIESQHPPQQTKSIDVNNITLRPEMVQRIKVGQVEVVNLADRLKVPSQVEIEESNFARIGANVTGRIIEVYAKLGDNVKAGTALARIASQELTQAQLAYLRASSQTHLAERAAERAKLLLEADVIGSAELQRRESELQVSRAELSAALDQLRLLGVDRNEINQLEKSGHILPSVTINTPIGGTVIERSLAVGQVVLPTDLLFKVADLSNVWVVGDVPEQNASNVEINHHVEIHVPALGDISFDGLIVFVADTVDPATRTVMVRTEVENPLRNLKPSMLANMYITESPHKTLVVPEQAVVRENNQDYVFIAQGENSFLRVPVELASEVNRLRPVVEGLTEGQKIIIDGAFHLDNERKLAELE